MIFSWFVIYIYIIAAFAFFGNYVSIGIRQKIRKAYPYMMMLMACLLILRGMGLGIPYVSPKADVEKKEIKSETKSKRVVKGELITPNIIPTLDPRTHPN